eukprot:scaffold1659_cov255-Pinguiococcus_pyrenoidosus.AAC.24
MVRSRGKRRFLRNARWASKRGEKSGAKCASGRGNLSGLLRRSTCPPSPNGHGSHCRPTEPFDSLGGSDERTLRAEYHVEERM